MTEETQLLGVILINKAPFIPFSQYSVVIRMRLRLGPESSTTGV